MKMGVSATVWLQLVAVLSVSLTLGTAATEESGGDTPQLPFQMVKAFEKDMALKNPPKLRTVPYNGDRYVVNVHDLLNHVLEGIEKDNLESNVPEKPVDTIVNAFFDQMKSHQFEHDAHANTLRRLQESGALKQREVKRQERKAWLLKWIKDTPEKIRTAFENERIFKEELEAHIDNRDKVDRHVYTGYGPTPPDELNKPLQESIRFYEGLTSLEEEVTMSRSDVDWFRAQRRDAYVELGMDLDDLEDIEEEEEKMYLEELDMKELIRIKLSGDQHDSEEAKAEAHETKRRRRLLARHYGAAHAAHYSDEELEGEEVPLVPHFEDDDPEFTYRDPPPDLQDTMDEEIPTMPDMFSDMDDDENVRTVEGYPDVDAIEQRTYRVDTTGGVNLQSAYT
eukprot:GFYU01010801.1.p1 GENE.GFYU01010801.1~~GFYU01010801.1.p1  ORF type:complete len:395 (+),score=69.70 GFYU01010801.1:190-1374(+)